MDALFRFSVLLFTLLIKGSSGKDESCLSQPNETLLRKTGQSVLLECTVRSRCATVGMHYEWFSFKENSHLHINVSENPHKYSLDGASLRIRSLQADDSGIYHCAAASQEPGQGQQHVALGRTLVVWESANVTLKNVLLWFSFTLLVIYSVVLATLMINKAGCSLSICRRMQKTYKKKSSKKRQFHDVLQEINSRNKMERRPEVAARPDVNNPSEDIYQNVMEGV